MPIDMSQFHQIFFEESFEGLGDMETGLLNLGIGTPDEETINTIFRAAHSIKGGSGTFGFLEITDFTHVLETLLDEMRSEQREVTQEAKNLLLESVDCLREMLSATRDSCAIDGDRVSLLKKKLQQLLEEKPDPVVSVQADDGIAETVNENISSGDWQIEFKPYLHLLSTGNDPLRMFRELAELGELKVEADTSGLPSVEDFQPDNSYLNWKLQLQGTNDEGAIREVFEWVDGDCELLIERLHEPAAEGTVVADSSKLASRNGTDRRQGEERRKLRKPFNGPDRRASGDRRLGQDRRAKILEGTSIRVDINKIDALINMVGELVITQSMLSQFSEDFDIRNMEKLSDGLALLERNTRELQENVMQIRMLPISFSFNRFSRLVHDLSSKLGKKIELKVSGEQTELDKTVMEKIGDPLVHLVRNSIDHGIEMPQDRIAAGKPEKGLLHLNAFHEGGNIVIEISDDGAGLNKERILAKAIENGLIEEGETIVDDKINDLIFMPGFSTVKEISDISGRGVGMDVVKRNIKDLGGVVEVRSREGQGSTFTIRLPLTLAILDGQLVRVGEQIYVVPLVSIVESLQVDPKYINSVAGMADLYRLREDYIPIVRLYELFNTKPENTELEKGLLVVVEAEGQKIGIFVDDLMAQQQVVIKSLETNFRKVEGLSGATILGDGRVATILDIAGLINLSNTGPDNPKDRFLVSQANVAA